MLIVSPPSRPSTSLSAERMTRSAGGGKLAFLADDGTLVEIRLVLGWLDGVVEEIKGFAGIDDGTPVVGAEDMASNSNMAAAILPAIRLYGRQSYGRSASSVFEKIFRYLYRT